MNADGARAQRSNGQAGLLDRLAQRALGTSTSLRPRLPGLFEPVSDVGAVAVSDSADEQIADLSGGRRVQRAREITAPPDAAEAYVGRAHFDLDPGHLADRQVRHDGAASLPRETEAVAVRRMPDRPAVEQPQRMAVPVARNADEAAASDRPRPASSDVESPVGHDAWISLDTSEPRDPPVRLDVSRMGVATHPADDSVERVATRAVDGIEHAVTLHQASPIFPHSYRHIPVREGEGARRLQRADSSPSSTQPQVHITIGRVEVKAPATTHRPAQRAMPPSTDDLSNFLSQRERRR